MSEKPEQQQEKDGGHRLRLLHNVWSRQRERGWISALTLKEAVTQARPTRLQRIHMI